MGIAEALVKIRLLGRKRVAQFGNTDLIETRFRIEKASRDEDEEVIPQVEENVAHVSYQPLLPQPTESEYVSVNEAAEITKLSASKIQKLCRDEIVPSEKVKGKWSVHLPSLHRYVRS